MTMINKLENRKTAWRIFTFHAGISMALLVLSVFPVLFYPDQPYAQITPLLAAAMVLGLSLYCATRFMRLIEEAHDKISTLSAHDDLTGLPNRRWFFDRLDEEVDRAFRYGNSLSMIMIDIDHFKRVNDSFGHPLGDMALAEVSRLLSANVRTSDIVARYGGEEFVVLLPETLADQAVLVAEKLRMVVEVNDISLEGPQVKVTISCGVADLRSVKNCKGSTRDAFVLAADNTMHRAKKNGRNQVLSFVPKSDRQIPLV
ncbi:GGDEF domain-containing protein [Pseudodesulfovibrio nedwellii]|nr:GGDEF domain-containing protein [Pseudodesulfovibrio nedwellii]